MAAGIDPAAVAAFCLMFALVLCLPSILNDGDTLWQIRAGEWMLDHRAIPTTDPFSFAAGERRWFAHEWLAEILMALAFRAGGMAGVMVLAAGAAGLTAAILRHQLRRFLPGRYVVVAIVVALANAAPSLLARPHLLAWPCLALWCGGLVAARANRTRPCFALLPLMLVWVNLHGSFMIGLLLAAALMIEALFDPGAERRRVLVAWAGFVSAAWATAVVNPDTVAGALFPFHLVNMSSLAWIDEWRPADFNRIEPLELTILGGLALGFSGKVGLPPIRLLMLLGLVHGALAHARDGQILGIVGALILAEPLGASLGPGRVPRVAGRWLAGGAAAIAVVALACRIALPLGPARTGAAFSAAIDRLPAQLRAMPVLNDYSLGGQLIFSGVRPFIDGRADLYGDAFLARYRRIVTPDHAELQRVVAEYGIAWTIFPSDRPIVQLLDREPGWRRLFEADGMVIHSLKPGAPR